MHFFYNLVFLLASFKWGDWRNWREYYATYLFFIGGDLFKNAILHDYRLWSYKESIYGSSFLHGHLVIDLMIMLIVYSSTLVIYLGNFPKEKFKQFLWIVLWVFLYSSIEFINLTYLNLINHYHGWNMFWSLLFNFILFTVLKIHVKKPLIAWGISILFFIFLWNVFDIPADSFD